MLNITDYELEYRKVKVDVPPTSTFTADVVDRWATVQPAERDCANLHVRRDQQCVDASDRLAPGLRDRPG